MSPHAFLLNPPSLPGSTANREGSAGMGAWLEEEAGFVYPPHLLATGAAALRGAGWQVTGLDAVAARLDIRQTLDRLPSMDLLVLPVSFATLAADRAFLNRLRERKPLQRVLAIGPSLSYPQVAHALNDLADLLLAGEPELALPAAARCLLAGECRTGQLVYPYSLAQAAYHANGTLNDLDALPLPAWDVLQPKGYRYPFLTLLSSRGCPAGCGFCPYVAAQGDLYRAQSPARTADEMAQLAERFQATHVMFRDPVFAHDRSRVLALCAELRHRRPGLAWECESRPEHFDGRLLRAMKGAGCTTIKFGLETADPELLVAIGRVQDGETAHAYLAQVDEVAHACHRLGLICRVFVMAGLPGQSVRSAERTASRIAELGPVRLHVKPFQWYPGIALPQTTSADVADQLGVLRSSTGNDGRRWRRLAGRMAGWQARAKRALSQPGDHS